MNERERQRHLDVLAMRYLTALDGSDFDAVEALWEEAEQDRELGEMLHGLNAEYAATEDEAVREAIAGTIGKHLPSAIVEPPERGPVTVAEVAEHLSKHPPRGLALDDLRINAVLAAAAEPVPAKLGLPDAVAWGRRFGIASEAYWRAFREAALVMRLQRESQAENYQMAARPAKSEGTA